MPWRRSRAGGVAHLIDRHLALHRVEDALRAALGTNPHPEAAETRQRRGDVVVDALGARDALERQSNAAPLELARVRDRPRAMDREHVVRVPQALRVIALDDRLDFVGDIADRTAAMRFAEDGSAAPGAGVRATARGDERHRAAAVAIAPRAEIPREIDRLAIGIRLAVEIGHERASGRARGLAVFTLEHDAVDLRQIRIRSLPRRSSAEAGAWSATISSSSVCSPSPMTTTSAPASRYDAAWCGGSGPPMTTFAPRRLAIAIIASALRFVIRLTAMPTIGGRSRSSVAVKSAIERNVPSNTPTSKPRCFRCDDRYSRPSGGCGRMTRCSAASSERK